MFSFRQGDYLDRFYHRTLGMEPLSILYALPQASAMWSSTLLFSSIVAFAVTLESNTSRLVVISIIIAIVLFVWFLYLCLGGRDDGSGSSLKETLRRTRLRIPNAFRSLHRSAMQIGRRIVPSGDASPSLDGNRTGRGPVQDIERGMIEGEGEYEGPPMHVDRVDASDGASNAVDAIPSVYATAYGQGYMPRRTTAAQNLTATFNHIAETTMNNLLLAFQRISRLNGRGRDGYQIVEQEEAGSARDNVLNAV